MADIWLLLHILVLVYWLGGDLGAFYASRFVMDPAQALPARILAARIVEGVDMAPRMGLVLALPTGLALAISKGWLAVDAVWIPITFGLAAGWAVLVWMVHLKAGPVGLVRRLDLGIRLALVSGLVLVGLLALTGVFSLPLFLALKLLILAAAIVCGLMIRRTTQPFGVAFGGLAAGEQTAEIERAIATSLTLARRYVLAIWSLLLLATALGIFTPV